MIKATIMEKSLQHYNYINAKKLEDIKANIIWSKSKNPKLPIYVKTKIENNKIGWKILFLNLKP